MSEEKSAGKFQYMKIAERIIGKGPLNKGQILTMCAGTGICEYRLSTYLWDIKKFGGTIIKVKSNGPDKPATFELIEMPRERVYASGRGPRKNAAAAPAAATMTAEQVAALITDNVAAATPKPLDPPPAEPQSSGDAEVDAVLEAARKERRRERDRARRAAQNVTPPETVETKTVEPEKVDALIDSLV